MAELEGNPDIIIFMTLTVLYATFGTVGNILIITVYVSKNRTLSQQNILALALVDSVVCLLVMPYRIVYELKKIQNDPLCRGMDILSHATVTFSNLLLFVICIERFVKVWKPSKIISERRSISFILLVLGFSLVISLPVAAIYMVVPTENKTVGPFCQASTKTVGELGMAIYVFLMLILNLIVLLALVVLYSLIYCRLFTNQKKIHDATLARTFGTQVISKNSSQSRLDKSINTKFESTKSVQHGASSSSTHTDDHKLGTNPKQPCQPETTRKTGFLNENCLVHPGHREMKRGGVLLVPKHGLCCRFVHFSI